ncbi:hypothetical protein TKK_0010165 [Trichogramma kaykai]
MILEFPEVAVFYRQTDLRGSMYNYRRLNVPLMPVNCHELAARINEFPPIHVFYVGHYEGVDGEIALMFIHPTMRQPLRECTTLFGDGTFKIRPHDPPDVAQIYTFHVMRYLSVSQLYSLSLIDEPQACTKPCYEKLLMKSQN